MAEIKSEETSEKKSLNFIEQIVENDLKEGKNDGKVQTRFPPEPNGYLHIGHAKAICLDFGIAAAHGGVCNLRFDDTNPTKEDVEYVEAIKEDIQWLGYRWGNEYYASDYFQQLWDFAIRLIKEGKAYIDEQTSEQIAAQKGTPTQPGVESPYRNRPIEETLDLFQKMNTGEIEEGAMVLRAKIDMASPNMHFRDPIIYRVVKHPHHRTGTTWKAYPMYDFAHGQSDYFEGVTHSLCTLEFVPHRPLYDLFVDWVKEGKDLNDHRPHQYEFNKLNLSYTLMSKRNLLTLVKEGLVNGWDDPRMPTICGFRRRGYSPESIHKFIDKIGYTTYDALNEFALLESAVREDLNARATRISAVLNPVKLVITNYPEGQVEEMEAVNNPERPEEGSHNIEFSRELWIERDDFMEDAADQQRYQIANNGYPVILCNVGNFYMDMAYNGHPDERGLDWGGYVDESVSFSMLPFSIYRSLRTDGAGNPVDLDAAEKGKTVLTAEGRKNILGVQGQLFAETIRSFNGVEYLLFPKIMGLAERGWNAYPAWEELRGAQEQQAFNKALALYYEKISDMEMPYWARNGINFRLPHPGLLVKDGKLYANVAIRGAEIRYTTDGSEPDAQSALWEAPVPCHAPVVKAKTFCQGKESLPITLKTE